MERRRAIRLMADKGLVSVGRRSSDLLGAGWPLRDISEGGLRFAVPADGPELPDASEGVVVTIDLGPASGRDGSGVAEGQAPRSRAASPKAAADRLPPATVGGAAHEATGVGEGALADADASTGGKGPTGGERPPKGRPIRLSGMVRRVGRPVRGEREVSIEFTGLSRKDRDILRGVVLDLAMENIEKTVKLPRGRSRRRRGADQLGDILVARRAISREDLERFLHEDYREGKPLGRQLVARGLVDETAAARALAEQAGLRYVDLGAEGIDLLKIRQFGEAYLTQHLFVPLSLTGSTVTVAAAEPLPDEVADAVQKQYNRPVRTVIASERQIVSAIQKAFHVSRNRRAKARFRAGLTVRFKVFDESWRSLHADVQPGLTKNLSDGGMLFVGPEPEGVSLADLAPKMLHVGVHLFLPNQDEPVRAPCELVRTVPLREADGGEPALFLYGVRVLGVSDEDRRRLNLFRLRAYISWSAESAGG